MRRRGPSRAQRERHRRVREAEIQGRMLQDSTDVYHRQVELEQYRVECVYHRRKRAALWSVLIVSFLLIMFLLGLGLA